ncbi:serine/threonine-protein kinase [Nocardia crassostreae]|uniref:serine/threonine-protein kinase n=1 Tax=Nocardia crassostreae TaxID=53428 RepID=UPI0008323EEC|nr:serine/threonine-protein kinase [Nocardia crassostreae]
MEFAEGTTFAGYQIERKLGAGGMGAVYLAQHPRLPRKDALKVLGDGRVRDAEFRDRFLREAEIAAWLDHPNLVTVRDRGEEGDLLWIAMRYVDGVDLEELIARGREALRPERVVHIVSEAAQGLDEIHRAGLLHRDVKPANILVDERADGPDRVFVTDFGIARAATDSTVDSRSAGVAGTLAYAAPEQLRGGRTDRRADVYSLGCTLYHLLTGSPLFPRDTVGAVMYAHLNEPPPRPTARNPRLPAGFDAVIARALAKNPGDRFAECGELAAAAQVALAGGAVAGPPGRRSRRRVLSLAALGAVLVLAAGTAAFLGLREPGGVAVPSNPPRTGTVEPAEWGAAAFIAEAFPDLLPPIPASAGYQQLSSCTINPGSRFPQQVREADDVVELLCVRNTDPVWSVTFTCNSDRSRVTPGDQLAQPEGDEKWQRASGSGHMFWGSVVFPEGTIPVLAGRRVAMLEVYFDNPDKSFCWLRVLGETDSGAALKDEWWPDAPL